MVNVKKWVATCQDVKNQCTFIAKWLINELDKIFLVQYFMNVINIIYLQYWV